MSAAVHNSHTAGPQTRQRAPRQIGNDVSGLMLDLQLPAAARRRRVTLANVSAVCEQLGEHVSTRNVHRVLGGSLRDIAPLVRAWRRNRDESTEIVSGCESAQALGVIVRGALQEYGAAVAAALVEQSRSNFIAQQAMLARIESLVRGSASRLVSSDVRQLRGDVNRALIGDGAATPASREDFAALTSRIERLATAIEHLQRAPALPRGPDFGELLTPVIARMDALGKHYLTEKNSAAAETHTFLSMLTRIEERVSSLKPAARAQASKAVLKRLDFLLATIARLPEMRKGAANLGLRKPAAMKAQRKTAPLERRAEQSTSTKAGAKKPAAIKKAAGKKAATQNVVAVVNGRSNAANTGRPRQVKRRTDPSNNKNTKPRKLRGTVSAAEAADLLAVEKAAAIRSLAAEPKRVWGSSSKRVLSATKRHPAGEQPKLSARNRGIRRRGRAP